MCIRDSLITVKLDCDLTGHVPAWPSLDALALKAPDLPGLLDFYTRFGFRTAKAEVERLLRGDAAGTSGNDAASGKSGSSAKAKAPKAKSDTNTGDLFGAAADAPADADGAATDGPSAPQGVQVDTHYDTVLTWPVFDAWRARIYAAKLVAFDTETAVSYTHLTLPTICSV